MFVCVILGCTETIFVDDVLGPFETDDLAEQAGYAKHSEIDQDEIEEDEWGRYCDTESGDPLFQVSKLESPAQVS